MKSNRHLLADLISVLIRSYRYNIPHGGIVVLRERNDRKFYGVDFAFFTNIQGTFRIYSETFIQIEYEVNGLTGDPVFEKMEDAIDFFKIGIVNKNWEAAYKIPTKVKNNEKDIHSEEK